MNENWYWLAGAISIILIKVGGDYLNKLNGFDSYAGYIFVVLFLLGLWIFIWGINNFPNVVK